MKHYKYLHWLKKKKHNTCICAVIPRPNVPCVSILVRHVKLCFLPSQVHRNSILVTVEYDKRWNWGIIESRMSLSLTTEQRHIFNALCESFFFLYVWFFYFINMQMILFEGMFCKILCECCTLHTTNGDKHSRTSSVDSMCFVRSLISKKPDLAFHVDWAGIMCYQDTICHFNCLFTSML